MIIIKMSCSICLESLQKTLRIVTKCDHTFHKICLEDWMKENNTCPLCRVLLNTEKFIPAIKLDMRNLYDFPPL